MAITTSTVNAPPSGTNPILVGSATVNAVTGDTQAIMLVDPDSASNRVASITANGLKVDGSAVTQPVSLATIPGPGVNSAGTGKNIAMADSSVAINAASSATATLVTGVALKSIYVTHFNFIANGTGTVQFAYGATPTALTGAYAVTPETGVSAGSGLGAIMIVPAGLDLKIVTSTAPAQGLLSYYQA